VADFADTVTMLRGIPLFAALDNASLKLIAFASTSLTLHAGEALCREGEPGDSVFIIQSGTVEVFITVDGRRTRLATLGRHQLLGEIAVISNMPRTASVCALGPVTALRIEAEIFLQRVLANPEAALGVMRELNDKLIRISQLYERVKRMLPEGSCPMAPGGG